MTRRQKIRRWWIRLHTCSFPGCPYRATYAVRWGWNPWQYSCEGETHLDALGPPT